jgi:predicted nucleic acid-binding Zn ribbon protein
MSDSEIRRGSAGALARVLGFDEPELSCEECFAQLDRYVELSLAGDRADREVPGMRAHLYGCPACAEDFRSLRELVAGDQVREG